MPSHACSPSHACGAQDAQVLHPGRHPGEHRAWPRMHACPPCTRRPCMQGHPCKAVHAAHACMQGARTFQCGEMHRFSIQGDVLMSTEHGPACMHALASAAHACKAAMHAAHACSAHLPVRRDAQILHPGRHADEHWVLYDGLGALQLARHHLLAQVLAQVRVIPKIQIQTKFEFRKLGPATN